MEEQMKRIAAFLSQYVECDGCDMPWESVKLLRDAIAIVINEGIMTISEMRFEALRDYKVIIPWDMFPEGEQYVKE